jgi:hypothetical protein
MRRVSEIQTYPSNVCLFMVYVSMLSVVQIVHISVKLWYDYRIMSWQWSGHGLIYSVGIPEICDFCFQ